MSNSEEQESFLSIDPHMSSHQTATELAGALKTDSNSIQSSSSSSSSFSNIKPSSRTGDISGHRPVIQGNSNHHPQSQSQSSTFKITQVGPVMGSNLVVSRMDNGSNSTSNSNVNTLPRPTSASPIPIAGPLAPANSTGNTNHYFSNTQNNTTRQSNPRNNANFYQNTANSVTKFTNMTVGNVGAKNPLKPNHYTVPNVPAPVSSTNLSTHPNSNLSAPNTSGMAPKTTLKASDLIHILPNLFNTLKRRNSNSGASGANGSRPATGANGYFSGNGAVGNSLAAAVAAAASNSGKPMTQSSAAALVAEQLLNVAASGPFSDDSSPSPPPQSLNNNNSSNQQAYPKRVKLTGSALQCEICGKVYKHRNCLSKHMWEHHDSWEHTKKVCQTKHQQVQLLEAAQVLSEILSGKAPSAAHKSNYSGSEDEEDDGEVIQHDQAAAVDESYENISIGDLE